MARKLPYPEFAAIYAKVPRFCVDLVIDIPAGILLTKRDIYPDLGWWHLPGGTVLMEETIPEAIRRVANEELQTGVTVVSLLGIREYHQSGLGYPISAQYLVKPDGPVSGGPQARTVAYFRDTVPPKTLPEVRAFIREYSRLGGR